ncbi:beta-lactamase family protein [Pelomonas sp. CA6]|uniref:serine hydrolase domain-containing protein n=1 Tax=Pelomonas sp. CA6 TaxID=2907999 RepID=UPI001F4BFDBD|nr:serine hydrolase [Pelomonas sp. CA6]MCH7345121.1 beta-lactamase family protein [Pelomonas sp. CA6]
MHRLATAAAALLVSSWAFAAPPDALASDPARMGWMKGAPPPSDRTLRFADGSYAEFPAWRWSVAHFRELMPTVQVSRGLGAPAPLPRAERDDLDALSFTPLGGDAPITWAQSLALSYTDGVVVLHRGRIIYERYFGALTEDGQHGLMSVTKSFTGLLGAMLVAEGQLDPVRRVSDYVPELARSAFGSATVRELLDMTTGIQFSEDYADPQADVWRHAQAGSPLPKPKEYRGPQSYYEFLQTVKPQGRHGDAFGYKTANSDALGWVIARVSGRSVAELLSERLWRRIGAEQDAYFTVDSIGTPFAGGGLNAGLRDLARVGELLRNEGMLNGQAILPRAAIDDIRRGGSRTAFAKAGYRLLTGWSYRNMWWVTHNEHGAYMARGVHGQALYIDPKAEMVIARLASHPTAANAANDPVSLPAYHALAQHLLAHP